MKKIFALFLFVLGIVLINEKANAAPTSGGVYRITNPYYGNIVVSEDYSEHTLHCADAGGSTRYEQMWIFTNTGGSNYTIQNVFTGRYIQNQSAIYATFTTGTTATSMYVGENSSLSGYYNIKGSSGAGTGMHCDASYNIVPWYPTTSTLSATEWLFTEVEISLEDIAKAREDYADFLKVTDNVDVYNAALPTFFTDNSCSELNPTYAAMSDDDLRSAMSELPATIQEMAIKIKNDSWATLEKDFRVQEYGAYSNPDSWASILNVYAYSPINNPTGIYGNSGDIIYAFVGSDIPSDVTLALECVMGTSSSGTTTALKKGLNLIPMAKDKAMLFIRYMVNTTGDKVIADFPNIKIHIENGTLNGYFDKNRHTDADWKTIKNMASHEIIQVKGDKVMYHFHRSYVVAACPNTISDAIGWWDKLVTWEHEIMGIGDVCPSKFNNLALATDGPDSYMYATTYHTYYQYETLSSILPWSKVYNSSGGCWGPAHEIGHTNQGAINIIGCTEVSNNVFCNIAIFNIGKYTSRGSSIATCANAFKNNVSYTQRGDLFSMTRMYYQLFLYYHAAGHKTDFYPTLFKLLRADPLVHSYYAQGSQDQLKFAEKCCEAAGEDLSEFFEAWGFFVPLDNAYVGDYSMYYLTVSEEQIAASKAKMQSYPKKSGNIMFIEDRVGKALRTDGVEGYKLDFDSDVAVGKMGDVGGWGDYVGDGAIASGYYYTLAGTQVTVSGGTDAVGFKVYDDGKLVAFSNTYSFSIPESSVNGTLTFVAAQANGEDVAMQSSTEGTEEQQLAALTAAITAADTYMNLTDATEKKVGYFSAEAVANLQAVYEGAVAAKANSDQSVHAYGDWATLLNAEIVALLSQGSAKLGIKEKNYYSVFNASYPSYGLTLSGTNLACVTNTSVKVGDARKKWAFEPTGNEDQYYIRNKGGNYITFIDQSVTGTATSSNRSDALAFNVKDVGDGTFYIQSNGEDYGCLHCDAGKNLVGWDSSNKGSHWLITLTENNAEKYELAALDSLNNVACGIIEEVVDSTLSTETEIVLWSNVSPKTTTFIDDLKALIAAYEEGITAYGNLKDYGEIITLLENSIANVQGKYNVMPYYPTASSESEITWYYIKNLTYNKYCGVDTVSSRYSGNINMVDLAGNEEDYSLWWCFIPAGNENEYYIYNYKTGRVAYKTSNGYVKVDGESLGEPYLIALDEEEYSFTLLNGEYYWSASSTYTKVAKNASYWLFEKIKTESSTLLTGINTPVIKANGDNVIYDLNGRKVKEAKKGIYIINGVKTYIK